MHTFKESMRLMWVIKTFRHCIFIEWRITLIMWSSKMMKSFIPFRLFAYKKVLLRCNLCTIWWHNSTHGSGQVHYNENKGKNVWFIIFTRLWFLHFLLVFIVDTTSECCVYGAKERVNHVIGGYFDNAKVLCMKIRSIQS